MTHTADSLGLLAAIAEFPAEDTPRLAYADYLDSLDPERVKCPRCLGIVAEIADCERHPADMPCPVCEWSGTVLDTTNAARAEFIRLQCELGVWCQSGQGHPREKALLREHETAWRAGPKCETCEGKGTAPPYNRKDIPCRHCHGTGDAGGLLRKFDYTAGQPVTATPMRLVREEYERGFRKRVTASTLAHCVRRLRSYEQDSDNPVNLGDYAPTDWARAVLTATPERGVIQELVPLDHYPSERPWGWAFGNLANDPVLDTDYDYQFLPGPVFDLLEGGDVTAVQDWKVYPTHELAVSALGRALAAFCRR